MNYLQKIEKLLESKNLTIVYGLPREINGDKAVSLSIGDSDESRHSLGDKRNTDYVTVNLNVYAADYNDGLDTLLEIREEIESAIKSTVNIFFLKFSESGYDERLEKHILKSQYKIIEKKEK